MLGGAYSSHYRAVEREHVETIKTLVEHGKEDAIAKARKLSLETNRRRKALAVKRKNEAEREEKRRQHILAKRREKQREATEKFQRGHLGSRPPSGNSGKWSPSHMNTTRLEDALRIVRGSPRSSSAKTPGHASPTRTLYRQDSDPVNKRYFNKYAHPNTISATTNENLREKQAALHNKSLRNLTSSRSLFEQQLESHQQQLIHQQQKALQDFSEQVLNEIGVESALDTTLHGQPLERSDTSSLSSVDSLEETVSNDTLRESVDLDSFIALKCGTGDQQNETNNGAVYNTTKNNGNKTVKFSDSSQADNSSLAANVGQGSHSNGEGQNETGHGSRSATAETGSRTRVNDSYNAQLKAQLTAERIQQEKERYYQQRQREIQRQLEEQQQHKQLLLQQQQQQELQQKVLEQQQKQQALLQEHFQRQQREQLERQRQQQEQLNTQQQKHQELINDQQSHVRVDSLPNDEKENVRPKVHTKAWATPSPHPPASTPSVTNTQQNFMTHANPYSGKSTHTNVTVTTYANSVTGVSNHSATSVNNATTVQTSAVGQAILSVPAQSQSKTAKQETNTTLLHTQNEQTGAQTASDKNLSFLETVTNDLGHVQSESRNLTLTRADSDSIVQYGATHGRGASEKINTEKTVIDNKTPTSLHKNAACSPKVTSYQGYYVNSYAERYNASKVPYATETSATDNKSSGNSDKRHVGFVVDNKATENIAKKASESLTNKPNGAIANKANGSLTTNRANGSIATNTNGSISKGTLAFIDGQLTMLPDSSGTEEGADTADTDSVSTLCEDREPEVKEVKGILKRPNKVKTNTGILKKSGSTGNMRQQDIRDSLEIARLHLQTSAEEKQQKPTKKNVRFADLHYEELEVGGETEHGQDKLFVKRNTGEADPVSHKPPRPVSATAAKTTTVQLDMKNKPPRAQSASTIRTSSIPRAKTQIVRPQAAAHIITQNLNNQNGGFVNTDKKVTIINNDFMEKVPAMARNHSTQVVHTVTPTSVFAMTSVSYSRPVETKVNYAVSSIVMPNSGSPTGQTAPFIYPNYNAKPTPVPTSCSANPHQVGMNGVNNNGAVFDDNGIRIDRTPTDDEINFLWDKVRTCLNRNSQATPDKVGTPSSIVSDPQLPMSRQAAPVHQTYIDGNALGQFNSLNRVAANQSVYHTNLRRHNSTDNVNGYTKRFGLLQQRKQQQNPNSLKSRQQQQQQTYTVYQAPVPSQQEPQSTAGILSPRAGQDVTDSMAGFLAAEQLVDQSVSDSRINQAIDDAQNRQPVNRQPKGKSALSVEEQRLLESLDRLNDKLKITEAVMQNGSGPDKQQKYPQQYTHEEDAVTSMNNVTDAVGGFRGHTPIISPQRRVLESPQRRALVETANQKARLRITSAHLKRAVQQ